MLVFYSSSRTPSTLKMRFTWFWFSRFQSIKWSSFLVVLIISSCSTYSIRPCFCRNSRSPCRKPSLVVRAREPFSSDLRDSYAWYSAAKSIPARAASSWPSYSAPSFKRAEIQFCSSPTRIYSLDLLLLPCPSKNSVKSVRITNWDR